MFVPQRIVLQTANAVGLQRRAPPALLGHTRASTTFVTRVVAPRDTVTTTQISFVVRACSHPWWLHCESAPRGRPGIKIPHSCAPRVCNTCTKLLMAAPTSTFVTRVSACNSSATPLNLPPRCSLSFSVQRPASPVATVAQRLPRAPTAALLSCWPLTRQCAWPRALWANQTIILTTSARRADPAASHAQMRQSVRRAMPAPCARWQGCARARAPWASPTSGQTARASSARPTAMIAAAQWSKASRPVSPASKTTSGSGAYAVSCVCERTPLSVGVVVG